MKRENQHQQFVIVVVQAGFVYVGVEGARDTHIRLTSAANIRQFGTTRGLGELAFNGPTPKTQLDPCGYVNIPLHAEICSIPCHTDWSKSISK